jgi:hypothetical protein
MKESISLLCNLLLSSTLFWAVPSVEAEQMISSVPTDDIEYCHLKLSAIHEDSLSSEPPGLDASTFNIMDFYEPCDYGSLGFEEIRVPKRVIQRGDFGDGDQKLTSKMGG